MTRDFLYTFIRQYKYATLATVSPELTPQAACVGIAITPDLKILFDTVNDSRKYSNLILNPNIAFVIGCENEQTVQYEGIARIPNPAELNILLKSYFEVFPDGKERKETWKNIAYFCVEPKWIRYSDFNTMKIEEIEF